MVEAATPSPGPGRGGGALHAPPTESPGRLRTKKSRRTFHRWLVNSNMNLNLHHLGKATDLGEP